MSADIDAILRARAERLAIPPQAETTPGVQVLLCKTGPEWVGLPLDALARIAPFSSPAPLPGAAASALGVIARSGAFFQVYDLASLLGQAPAHTHAHIVFLRRQAPQAALAIAQAETIAEVTPLNDAEAAEANLVKPNARLARTQDGRIISILDIEALLSAVTPAGLFSKGDVA